MTPLERIGMAALALQVAVGNRSEARMERRAKLRQYEEEHGDGEYPAATLGGDDILCPETDAAISRCRVTQRAVKKARAVLRRATVRYQEAERRAKELEDGVRAVQRDLFEGDSKHVL